MTILGVIAAVVVTTFKPQQYMAQSYLVQRQRIFKDIDTATESILNDCTSGHNLFRTYVDCNHYNEFVPLYSDRENERLYAPLYAKYLRGTIGGCEWVMSDATNQDNYKSNIKLRNGACLYFHKYMISIYVDINDTKGPNLHGVDRFVIEIHPTEGVANDMPKKALLSGFACDISGCAECSNNTCTKCYCDYVLDGGTCKYSRLNRMLPGCTSYARYDNPIYSDSGCTNPILPAYTLFCTGCITSVATRTTIYYKDPFAANKCTKHTDLVTCNIPESAKNCESY